MSLLGGGFFGVAKVMSSRDTTDVGCGLKIIYLSWGNTYIKKSFPIDVQKRIKDIKDELASEFGLKAEWISISEPKDRFKEPPDYQLYEGQPRVPSGTSLVSYLNP